MSDKFGRKNLLFFARCFTTVSGVLSGDSAKRSASFWRRVC